jgi:DNA-directed RNA polymerase
MPWKTGDDAASTEEEANLPPGQHLLRIAVEPTATAIREFVADANEGKAGRRHSAVKWLELASPEEVAYLTARVVLNASVLRHSLQNAAMELSSAIIFHVDMVTFRGKNRPGYHGLVRKTKKIAKSSAKRLAAVRKLLEAEDSLTEIGLKDRLHLGMAAIELLIDATGLFTMEKNPAKGGKGLYLLRPTEAVQQWLARQHDRSALLQPLLMPMVVRPRRWRTPRVGGYLRRLHGRPFVKNNERSYQEALAKADLRPVYSAINHIQETPWRINRRVLGVLREAWDGGGIIGGLPPRHDKPLPAKPMGMEEDADLLAVWKREAAQTHEFNAQLLGHRLLVQQRLWIADKFVDERAIWFPHALDFRGRVYPLPATAIHPQADDGGKALLEFAHGLPIGEAGAYWLAVHIANLFGVDKVSFKDRVKWTYDHARELIDSAINPLDGERFWTTADDPWMALAAAFEFAGFLKEGVTYVSRLPIPLDGSNSGLQHFSALLRDPEGARSVNLVPTRTPADVYATVAEKAQRRVDADPSPEADPWRGGKVTRKIAKRPTMTYVYSATRFGMQGMILQTLRELDEEGEPYLGGADNYEAAKYLSHILYQAVSEVVHAATEAMGWLRRVARTATEAGTPLTWTTPDGLPIHQAYRIGYGERVSVHWKGQRLTLMLGYEGAELDVRGQSNGVAPNYVHSLDAAHLRALSRAAKAAGIDYLAVIHDSFATHAARTDELARLLRDTFVDQYDGDLLSQFRDEIAANLPEGWELPPPPALGSLDLEEVRHSPYLFA